MATLHVRNVPDELYELLRERASANDRSIGAETVQLLQERLALVVAGAPPRRFPGRRRSGGAGRFTRFTTAARQAVACAQTEARDLGHAHVGTEHLLLGVLAVAPRLVSVTPERVRAELPAGDAHPTGQIPFTPAAKRALELALRAALKQRCDAITPAHLLLGILDQGTGGGAELLRAAEPEEERFRGRLADESVDVRAEVEPSFRVIALEGDADAWEAQLNEAAALGYELVEVVDRRAILRR
jgi:hypothetical protein